MRTQTSYLLIGSFVIAGLALLTAGVVVLGAGARERDVVYAETLFDESVSGLEVGAPVRFRGVTVGRVSDISVAGALYQGGRHTYVVVRFELWGPDGVPLDRLRETLPQRVEEGLRVRLASTGVTGIAFLEADILPDASRYPPKPRDWMSEDERARYLYIPSAPSALGEVVSSLETALRDVARADLPGLVQDIRAGVKTLQEEVRSLALGELRDEVRGTIESVREAVRRADREIVRLAESFDGAARAFREASAAVGRRLDDPRVEEILAEVKAATGALAGLVATAQTALGDAADLLAGRAGTVAAILANLERMTAHLRNLSATAEQYPSWLLFGTPPQGGGR